VVTGANRGIGRDVARQLAGRGFVVIAGARDPGQGERTARQLDPAGSSAIAVRLDVTNPASIEAAAAWTRRAEGARRRLADHAGLPAAAAPQRPRPHRNVSSEGGSISEMTGASPPAACPRPPSTP
jgi:NAD(P)-dependent dehydrogenase (short-subunit alcohol dehydrogenase family)